MNNIYEISKSNYESNEYEETKKQNKQRLVRNEFKGVGKYGIPFIKKHQFDIDKIELLNYTKTKANDNENKNKTIHFLHMIGCLIKSTKSQNLLLKN